MRSNRYIFKFLFVFVFLIRAFVGFSQPCFTSPYGVFPSVTFTPACTGTYQTITSCGYRGEYSRVNVVAGTSYTFQSSVATDIITIDDNGAAPALTFGTGTVTWVATYTGVIRFYTHGPGCAIGTGCRTRRVLCSTPCASNTVLLNLLDSYGDGWNGATYTLTNSSGVVASSGTLNTGFSGTVTLCLPSGCYTMSVTAGTWPGEVSWNYSFNGTTVASGGAPSTNIQIPINSPCPPQAPTSITASPLSICTGQSSTLTASGVVGTVYWYTGSCGGTLVGTGNSINVTPATTTTYFARNFSNGIFSVNCVSVTVTVNSTPPAPTVTGTTTICAGSSTTLTASNSTPPYTWYTNANGTGSIGTGATFTTPVLNNNTTYYVGGSSSGVAPTNGSLSTTLAGGNGCWSGNMFNVIAGSCNINITGFTVTPTNAGAQTVAVYYKAGTYVGFQTIPGAWILLGNYPINAVGAGAQTFFNCANISIPANTTSGIYVSFDAIYSNTGGPYTNGDITITPGEGLCNLFGGQNVPRTFNGTIHYQKLCNASCPSPLTPVAITIGPSVTPTFNPVGPYCSGGSIPPLPTSSTNGITGTWSPVINNSTSTTYTFTPNPGQCAINTTATVTINPLQPITGTLSACLGLTSQLSNAVTPGTWSSSNTGVATISATGLVTGVSAGTSTITYNASNGCSTTSQYTVYPQPVLTVTPSNVLCFGGSGSVTLSASGANAPYTYGGSPTQNLQPGTYTYTATSVDGCVSSPVSITITQPQAALALTTTQVNVLCSGNNTGSIDLTATGGTAPYTYAWSNNTAQEDPTGLAAGTYTVTVTDANGCTATATVTITQPASALALSTTQVNVLCFGNSTGSINLSPSGGTAPYTYAWSNNTTSQDPSNLIAGTYTVVVTDANGCTATISATITQPQAPLTLATTQVNVLCFGNSTGSIDLSPSGGTAPYTYVWSNNATIQDPLNLISGTYTVVVTDANGCTATISATITQPQAGLSVATTQTNVLCFGNSTGAINATPSGGSSPYTYSWSNGATSQNLSAIAAGVYTVTVTDANGCTSTISATITQPQVPLTLATTQVNVLCFGNSTGSIDLSPSGGTAPYTYAWSNNTTSQDPSNLIAGVYTVTVTDANGCTATISATITQPATAVSISTTVQNILCLNGTGSINSSPAGGVSPYTYSWSNQAITQNITNLQAGSYTVTVTDANGCTANAVGVVAITLSTVPVQIINSTGTNVLTCTTPAISLQAPGGVTYTWTGGQTPNTANNVLTIPGSYTVNMIDPNGCAVSQSIVITQNITPPTSGITNSTGTTIIDCNAPAINLLATGGGTYQWNTGLGTNAAQSISQAGSFTVVVTAANGCLDSSTVVLTVAPVPLVTGIDTTICSGQSVLITPVYYPSGGQVIWTNGQTTPNLTVSPTSTTMYSVLYTWNGCTATEDIIVTVNPTPTLNVTSSSICFGDTTAVVAQANLANGVYNWISLNQTGPNLTVFPIQTTSYTATYTLNGCTSAQATGTVTVNPLPIVSVADMTICQGQSGTLSAIVNPVGGNFAWSQGGTSATITESPSSTSVYDLTYTANGCVGNAVSASIIVLPLPLASFSVNNTSGCVPVTVSLLADTIGQNATYAWTSTGAGSQIGANPQMTFVNGGCYDVTLTATLNGCTNSTTSASLICVQNYPIANFYTSPGSFSQNNQTLSFINTSIGASGYIWNFGDGSLSNEENPNHYFQGITSGETITLLASTSMGCMDSISIEIPANLGEIYYIPNTFTPDGDKYNQVFKPVFTAGFSFEGYEMLIYNRWGELLFESQNPYVGWDGSYGLEGLDCPSGTYSYKISIKPQDKEEILIIMGHVNLLR